jgi:hypothetical protein
VDICSVAQHKSQLICSISTPEFRPARPLRLKDSGKYESLDNRKRGYLAIFSWIRLILSHHEEHEDHKGKKHQFTFILWCPSCPSWLYRHHLNFLHNRNYKFLTEILINSFFMGY